MKVDWDAWCARSLDDEDIVRLGISLGQIAFDASLLDGTVIRTRLDRKATNMTNISVLAAIGVRRDGRDRSCFPSGVRRERIDPVDRYPAERRRDHGGLGQFLTDHDARGLKRPEFAIIDGAPPGLEAALVALWGEDLPIQRCTVHKHRNLLPTRPGACTAS